MSFKIKKSGAWADTGTVKVMKSGAWATAGFVKAMKGGVWEIVWPALAASLTNTSVTSSGSIAGSYTSRYKVGSDGTISKKIGNGSYTFYETWLTSGTNANFEVRFTETNTNSEGTDVVTLGTWLPTTSDNVIEMAAVSPGFPASREYLVEIRETITNTVLDSATITMDADRL